VHGLGSLANGFVCYIAISSGYIGPQEGVKILTVNGKYYFQHHFLVNGSLKQQLKGSNRFHCVSERRLVDVSVAMMYLSVVSDDYPFNRCSSFFLVVIGKASLSWVHAEI